MHPVFFTPMVILFSTVGTMLQAAPPLKEDQWKLDVVHRTKGRLPLKGLVQSQDDTWIYLKRIFRRRGKPTVVMPDRISRKDVTKVELLPPEDRKELIARLEKLAKERKILAAQLRLMKQGKVVLPPGEQVQLEKVAWSKEGRPDALLYESPWFRLVSNAREDIVQLTAIRLEQVYAAFQRHIPPRNKEPEPTTIRVAQSMKDYQRLVLNRGQMILNPAFYDSQQNEVICGSDLERLSESLENARSTHEALKRQIKERRDELSKIYNRRIPEEMKRQLLAASRKIQLAESRNELVFQRSVQRLYQRLYHEAFHAYLDTAVLGERLPMIPIWMNEGLAQIFENVIVDAGELRPGLVDPERLQRLRDSLRKKQMLPLTRLLKAAPRQFQVAHAAEQALSDRHYLAAWGLAYYLTFELQVVDSPVMEKYAQNLKAGMDPVKALERMIKKPITEIEKDLHDYLGRLKQDGTVAERKR